MHICLALANPPFVLGAEGLNNFAPSPLVPGTNAVLHTSQPGLLLGEFTGPLIGAWKVAAFHEGQARTALAILPNQQIIVLTKTRTSGAGKAL
jgi:hypothetical protein